MILSKEKMLPEFVEEIVSSTYASHCGGFCILNLHLKDGVVTRIEIDGGYEPRLLACLRVHACRELVYAPNPLLHTMRYIGISSEGKSERIARVDLCRTGHTWLLLYRNTRDDMINSYLVITWRCNPANNITCVNTN